MYEDDKTGCQVGYVKRQHGAMSAWARPTREVLQEQGGLKMLVSSVRCTGQVAPDDGTMQVAIKTSIDDQLASPGAQSFAGRNMQTVPFSNIDNLLTALADLSLNQTVASHSTRANGGGKGLRDRARNN